MRAAKFKELRKKRLNSRFFTLDLGDCLPDPVEVSFSPLHAQSQIRREYQAQNNRRKQERAGLPLEFTALFAKCCYFGG